MKWTEIRITTTSEAYDAISDIMTSIGAGGVAIEDPDDIRKEVAKASSLDYADDKFLEGLGEDVIVKAYFPGDSNITELVELVKEKISFVANFLDTGKGDVAYSEIDEENWATAWKKYYKPVRVSERVVIKPTWEAYKKEANDVVIEMDPGMAFGTGTHETTRMCAALLDKYVKQGDNIIDVGCGTGILSIIALKLGAGKATAVDVDEVAVRVAGENCRLNGVNDKVKAFKGVLNDIDSETADIIVANIIANVIIDISASVPKYLKPNGYFITSGIIKERKQEVIDAYVKIGFTHNETLELGEWVAMVFKCQGSL